MPLPVQLTTGGIDGEMGVNHQGWLIVYNNTTFAAHENDI